MKPTNESKTDILINVLGAKSPHIFGRRLNKYHLIALAVILVLAAIIIWSTTSKKPATKYKTEQVRRGELIVIVTATGTLQPTNTVNVGSELSGIIKSVEVNYNSAVKVGQVLARLDTSKLEAQLAQAKASLESAKAKLLQTQATVSETRAKLIQYQKVRELSNGKVPSQSEMDSAEAAFERAKADAASAQASIAQAQAAVQAYETDMSKSVIRSPINGIVLSRNVEPGQTVAAALQAPVLFTLAEDLKKMELHVNVDEADIGKIQEGQRASFTVSAYPNRTFDALITQARYASTVTSGVVTYETVLKVDNADLSLRPGMTATADITVQKVENAILIPSAALRFSPSAIDNAKESGGGSLVSRLLPRPPKPTAKQPTATPDKKGQQQVWIFENGNISPVPITTGASNGGLTEIVAGDLKPGMDVVVDVIMGGR